MSETPAIGDLARLLSEDGRVQNAAPWRVEDIAPTPDGEQFALFQ